MTLGECTALPIIGYVDPLRGRPGQSLDFKVSSKADRAFTARVVRIDCADPNPDGPGMKLIDVDFRLPSATFEGKEQATHKGSCAFAPIPVLHRECRVALDIRFLSTLSKAAPQMIASLQDREGLSGLAVGLAGGELVIHLYQCEQATLDVLSTGLHVEPHTWYHLRFVLDAQAIRITLEHAVGASRNSALTVRLERPVGDQLTRMTHVVFAARFLGFPRDCFNGRLEQPSLLMCVPQGTEESFRTIAAWDFSADMDRMYVPDLVNKGCRAELLNGPLRAVRSSSWSGHVMDWKQAPEEYAAIHFHEDDLADCQWETSVRLLIPEGIPSAIYGLVVENDIGRDIIPFFVTPPVNGPRAKIVYLVPTLTYLAYANHARNNLAGDLCARLHAWGAYPHNPDAVSEFGAATYNYHVDGTGVGLSSRLRPILTMRPGYLTFFDKQGSGLRHFCADSHLTDWLRVMNFDFDVVTDEDLDDFGAAEILPYQILITGTHPEYYTPRMRGALMEFRASGGHLLYLGGNGFYWKIARSAHSPHMLEIRRAEGGVRAWASEPGEYYNQFDGEYGGLWRRNGYPPQQLCGVGFSVQGSYEGSYYRRTRESYADDVKWIFNGIESDVFGDFGLAGGGAAGFELDQLDMRLGTPKNARLIAVSEGHGPSFLTCPEEILTWTSPLNAGRPHAGIHSHMIYTPPGSLGGLFSVGSITFIGSLPHNNYNNDISRILENCIRHFSDFPHENRVSR